MSDGLRVTLGGLSFDNVGRSEFLITPDGFEGWDDGVDMRLEQTALPQAHGSFDAPGFQDARTVSITGHAFADSPRHLSQLRSRLTGLLAGGQRGRIQVEQDGEIQWADGRLAAKTMFTRKGTDWASFQVQLWCPDPRKFGDMNKFTLPSGVPVTVYHRGNYEATPRFTITGDMPGYTLTVGGWNYAVSVPLVPGTPHVIDYNTGRLRINGAIVQNSVGNVNIGTVHPGASQEVGLFATSGGSGSAVMEIPDTFI